MKELIIIGAGPAGMTAAIYASGAGLSVTLIERAMYGGQMASTAKIENYPGFSDVDGWKLSQQMFNQVSSAGIEITYDNALSIEDMGDYKRVKCEREDYEARAVIIANGVMRRKLGCEGENKFAGRGVSYCAVCDGSFFKEKNVAVVGGGNSALEDAAYLSGICKKVYVIHRRDEFRADEKYVKNIMNKENVEIIYSHKIKSIKGDKIVNGVVLADSESGAEKELSVSGVFIAIGLDSDNKRFGDLVKLSDGGYVDSGDDCLTSCKGIFAAGDTRKKFLRQIVTATADGAVAAKQAVEYIRRLN